MRDPIRHGLRTLLLTGGLCQAAFGAESLSGLLTLLEEGTRLTEEARATSRSLRDVPPTPERNQAVSGFRRLLKTTMDKYELVVDVDPSKANKVQFAVKDLERMITWCDSNLVVKIPAASEAPPIQDEAKVAALCDQLSDLHGKAGSLADLVTGFQHRIQDDAKLIDGLRKDMKAPPIGSQALWDVIRACEVRRNAFLADIRKATQQIQAKRSQIRDKEEEIRTARALLESYRETALPVMARWAARHKDPSPPEGMVDYLNRQFATPQFSFTPVPADAAFPAEADLPPAARRATQDFLDTLSKRIAELADTEVSLTEADAEKERSDRELVEIDSQWAWRQANTPWSYDQAKKVETEKIQIRRAQAALASARDRSLSRKSTLQDEIVLLRARLDKLDPSMARVVEGWRRRQKSIPGHLQDALETWTVKILKP
jgi:hypothetical protein